MYSVDHLAETATSAQKEGNRPLPSQSPFVAVDTLDRKAPELDEERTGRSQSIVERKTQTGLAMRIAVVAAVPAM